MPKSATHVAKNRDTATKTKTIAKTSERLMLRIIEKYAVMNASAQMPVSLQ